MLQGSRDMRTITRMRVENFLSFRKIDLRLDSLNVLVGPNGAGKTNLLKVFEFLGNVARLELAPAIRILGGFDQVLFRGSGRSGSTVRLELEGVVTAHANANAPDEYRLSFSRTATARDSEGRPRREAYRRNEELVFKRYRGPGRRITLSGGRVTVGSDIESPEPPEQELRIQSQATGIGTLRRLSDAYGSPEWNAFAEVVEQLRLFEIDVGKLREPSDLAESNWLRADASNLAAFLLRLREKEPAIFAAVCDDVRYVYPSFAGFDFVPVGGSESAIRLDVREAYLSGTTPLGRASFGTLRSLALFAMLHDPNPPKLTALEEVDHGLHPHALDRVVERLRQASSRTQIILATHSPALVNRLSTEELVIVEREDNTGATRLFRPDKDVVRTLERETGYELGEMWFSGALGGGL